jgi:hypothetical protein
MAGTSKIIKNEEKIPDVLPVLSSACLFDSKSIIVRSELTQQDSDLQIQDTSWNISDIIKSGDPVIELVSDKARKKPQSRSTRSPKYPTDTRTPSQRIINNKSKRKEDKLDQSSEQIQVSTPSIMMNATIMTETTGIPFSQEPQTQISTQTEPKESFLDQKREPISHERDNSVKIQDKSPSALKVYATDIKSDPMVVDLTIELDDNHSNSEPCIYQLDTVPLQSLESSPGLIVL